MKYLAAIWLLVVIGCGIFNPGDDYNPNYTPKPTVEVKDSIRVDTIRFSS